MDHVFHPDLFHGFLLGIIATSSAVAGMFFLKFWRRTRDSLFLVFGVAFIVEALNRTCVIFLERPSEGSPAVYIIRLLVFVLILGAIIRKNYEEA